MPPVLRSTPPPPSCAPTILRLRLLRAQAVSAQPLLFSPSTAPASSSSPRCRHPSQFIMSVCPRGRFVGLASLELAWRSTRTVYSSSPPAPPPAPPPSSSNRAPGRAVYCVRPLHSRAAVPSSSPNRTPGRSAGNGCYREYETQQAHRLSSARSRTTLRHPCVRPYISASCTFTGTLWVGRLVLGGAGQRVWLLRLR